MLLFVLSGVGIHRSNFLKLGVKICTYNHHCSAPSSRALLVGLAPPTLLGLRSRHCHGINYTHHRVNERNRPDLNNQRTLTIRLCRGPLFMTEKTTKWFLLPLLGGLSFW